MIIIEILKIIFQAMWVTFSGIISALIDVLPTFFEIKELLSNLTPTTTDIIAYYLGIPAALISAIVFTIKIAKKYVAYD